MAPRNSWQFMVCGLPTKMSLSPSSPIFWRTHPSSWVSILQQVANKMGQLGDLPILVLPGSAVSLVWITVGKDIVRTFGKLIFVEFLNAVRASKHASPIHRSRANNRNS